MSTEVLLTISKPWRKPRYLLIDEFVIVVQLLSRVQLFVAPWTAVSQAFLSFTICKSLLKLMSIESVMPSNHLILCCLLLLLPSIFPSIRVFSNESALSIRWPKYWSFTFSISPFNEWIFRVDFLLDWLVQSLCCPRDSQEPSPVPCMCGYSINHNHLHPASIITRFGATDLVSLCPFPQP